MRGRRRMIVRSQRPGHNERSEPFEVFTRGQRSIPARVLGLVVRMRAEITVVVLGLVVWAWLVDRVAAPVAAVLVGITLAVLAAIGPTRRYLVRRALAVLTRHRLRQAFVERRVMNYSGNLPVLLWSRPTPVGERVWVLMRAGIDLADVEHNLDHIASTCFARAARATAWRAMTALVVVEVVRLDPLAAAAPASSVLTPADERWLRRVSSGKES